MGSMAGYLAWVPSVRGEVASHTDSHTEWMAAKLRLCVCPESLLFCPP
jgi:hypothetical protein